MTLSSATAPTELADASGKTYYRVDATHAVEKTVTLASQIGSVHWAIDYDGSPTTEQKIAAATKTATFTINKVQGRINFLTDNTAINGNAMAANFVVTATVQTDGTLVMSGSSTESNGDLYFRVDGGASSGTVADDGTSSVGPLSIAATV